MKYICLTTLTLFVFLALSTDCVFARVPLPQDLQLARQRFAKAKAEEKAAKKAISQAASIEKDVQRQLADSLDRDKRFDRLMSEYDALARAVGQKYNERAKWISPPPGWVAKRKELRRRWDILAPHRRHVEDNFWRALDSELRSVIKKLNNWAIEAKRKKKSIDREIRVLKRKRRKLDDKLASVVDVRLDDKLMANWAVSLASIDKANRRAQQAEDEVLNAYDNYLQIAASLGPAHVKKVELFVGSTKFYSAKWKQLHPETNKELDEEQAALLRKAYRKKIQKVESEIGIIKDELSANSRERYALAKEMVAPTKELEAAAKRYGDALVHKVYAQVAIEAATVVVEVALTGGTATLARKGAELAEKALEKKVRRTFVKNLDPSTYRAALSQASYRAARDNIDEAAKSIVLWRKKYIKEAVKRAEEKARARGKDVIVAGNLARRQAEKQCDKIQIAVKQRRSLSNSEWRKLKGPELEKWLKETKGQIRGVGANAISRKLTTAALLKATGTPKSENPVKEEVQSVALGEAVEAFVGTMAIPTITESVKGFREAAGQGAWRRIKAGATSGRKFYKVKNVKEILTNRANIAGVVGSLTKTLATAHFAGKAHSADLDFWATYAKLSAMYRVYYTSLSADYIVWRHLQKLKKLLAADKAVHSSLMWKRRLVIEKSETLTDGCEVGKCVVTFSTPLSEPPAVMLGNSPFKMKSQGSAVSGYIYSGTFSRDSFPKNKTNLTLSIMAASSNHPFKYIDGNPATPAYLPLIGIDWKGYEKKADRSYKIKVKGSGEEREAASQVVGHRQFSREEIKYIFKEYKAPTVSTKDIPKGKGRLVMYYRDLSGRYISGHKSIHKAGFPRPIVGTYSLYRDLTPSTYDVFATEPTPAIRSGSIAVRSGRVSTVTLGGYGRLRVLSRDGLGKEISTHIVIKKAGFKKALLGTWNKTVELEPGRYDLFFTSYTPNIEHKNFVIKRGCETKIETFGYGRIQTKMLDGLGKDTSSHILFCRSGEKKGLLGTWNKRADFPPGYYDVLFTSYEPDIVFRGVRVSKHKQTNVTAGGYGRVLVKYVDSSGKKVGVHTSVHYSGREKAFYGTWNATIDLPPGFYDFRFSTGGDGKWSRAVAVRAYKQVTINVRQ